MGQLTSHAWRFFCAGGFEQVLLENANDLKNLRHLDQKLWASLACPTEGLEFDQRLLDYIDSNADGRIRAPEILATIDWLDERLATLDILFANDGVKLSDFADTEQGKHMAVTAERLLKVIGRAASDSLSANDTDDLSVLFPPNLPNGDGLIPVTITEKEDEKALIAEIIASLGSSDDRSGEAAISADQVNEFFAQIQAAYEWYQQETERQIESYAENTASAAASLQALQEKIDDYFNRVDLVAFDSRAAALINGEESELVRLSSLSLADTTELLPLPLAKITDQAELPLKQGVNPAWRSAVASFVGDVVQPLFGELDTLSLEQWQQIKQQFAAYFAWSQAKPALAVMEQLSAERVAELAQSSLQESLLALIAMDLSVEEEANGLLDLDKLLRCQRDLIRLLKNFISFQHFYGKSHKAIFQAGTLYIDGKSCDLAIEVNDIEAHAAVAAKSENYLLYCTCTRRGQPIKNKESINIAVAVTAGEEGDLIVGRNGLFYDRQGNDWDATVVKVITNPISVREAFWSPYRRISSFISDKLQAMAASRDAEVVGKATAAADEGEASNFDIGKFAGIFAAIGLAFAALGTVFAALIGSLSELAWWQWPLVLIAIILLISGPSMVLAWFKLRRRNLGPILDGNGWAVNTKAKISIDFGTRLTQLAQLPEGSSRHVTESSDAEKRSLLPWLLTLLIVASGVAAYFAYSTGMIVI